MPKIKRYWPCSHGFNRDPEIQELRRTYADWMGYVWQEMCAIGDLNEGEVKGTPEEIGLSLAYVSMTKRPSLSAKCITNALHFMEKRRWIVLQTDRVLIVNHAKYHTYQTDKKVPPNDPNKHNKRSYTPKVPKGTVVEDLSFRRFWEIYPKKVGKDAAYRAWSKEAKHCSDVQDNIFAALEWQVGQAQWTKDNGQYIPNPATWLNQGRWKDSPPPKHADGLFNGQLSERTMRILKRGL